MPNPQPEQTVIYSPFFPYIGKGGEDPRVSFDLEYLNVETIESPSHDPCGFENPTWSLFRLLPWNWSDTGKEF